MIKLALRTIRCSPSTFSLALTPRYTINNWKLPAFELDSAGISGFFQSRTDAYLTFSQKMTEIKPGSLYYGFDEWTRELLVTLSADLGCGFGTSIIIATIAIKALFLYPTLRAQMQGLRQAEMKQLSQNYKQRMKVAQQTRNKMLMQQAQFEYKMGMKKKGISQAVPLLNLLQVPILLTWFFSLRYMSNLPEIYPQVLSEGYLWFTDLSTYDPYFVLPVMAAVVTSLSIARSPNLARNNLTMPLLAPFVKYLKYMPFFSLAFTGFFPASINLYWLTLAACQLATTQLMYTNFARRKFGMKSDDHSFKTIKFDEAVFVQEKLNSEQVMQAANKQPDIPSIQQIQRNLQKGETLQVKEVKVSTKKPAKKKRETA